MQRHFASISDKNHVGTGWPMCWVQTGTSNEDDKFYSIELLGFKADEIPDVLSDAKTTAELIAGLLNAWANHIDISKHPINAICRMGKPLAVLNIPHPTNTELPF